MSTAPIGNRAKIIGGVTKDYVMDKTPEQVVANTLQGALIFMIKTNGPLKEELLI